MITEETALFDQQIMSFRNSSYMTKSNVNIIFSLDKYDADHSSWLAEISENGVKKNVSINIDPNQARLLWSNISQIKVNEIKKLSNPTDRFLIIFYNNNTNPIHLQSYRNKKTYDSNGESVFTKVEVDASFPGGMGAWTRFLANNLESTLPGENGANPGVYTVMVRFIVNKDGSVSDVQAETNHGYGMEQEAIRVIKKSGRWTPAIQNGRNVTAYKRQSMTWSVAE